MRSLLASLILFAVSPAGVTFAATGARPNPFPQPSGSGLSDLNGSLLTGPKSVIDFIDVIANWIFVVLITIAVIYILLAAFNYLSASGGEGVEKAHKMLIYAAVGIAVAVLAKGIVFAVRVLVDNTSRQAPASAPLYDHTA